MSNRVKKVKHIVINASNIKKINNDHNKNDNNNQPANNNPPTNTRLPLSQQQMETSSYRLSRVRNNTINNRFVETEIKESFCTSFFRDNPEMLDTRLPSIKLYEYYDKLGLYFDNNSVHTKKSFQKNRKVKINSDDIIKFNNDVKYSHSDNFSLMSYQKYIPNFTRKEKIQLLSQMIPLELIVHGKDSFELLRAHIMIAYFYNRMCKPHPAIRHLNEAQKIREKILNMSNPKNPTKYYPSSIEKSSRISRKASPSSIRSQRRSIYKQQEYDQLSVRADGYHLNEETEKEVDDEISLEFSNAYLMLAMDDSTSSSAKSKYIKNAIISLSKFIEESDNTNSESNNDHLKLQKDLAQARLLFVQKKFEESARYYENVLSSIVNASINENESKTSKSDKKSSYDIQIKSENKGLNEAVKLDELEEIADLKIEAAENIKMIIKGQFNAIKEKEKKIKSCREFEETHYENLIDDIDYALDLYYEARDSYEDAGLDDNVEDCEICIQKLENEKDEVYSILDKEKMQKRYLVDQEEENDNESKIKDDQNQLKNKVDQSQIKKESQIKITEKGDKNQHENESIQNTNQLKDKDDQNQFKNKAHINTNVNNDESAKQQKIDHKKGQIAENTVEIHFESSSSFDEKEGQLITVDSIQKNESKSENSIKNQENKQKVEFSTPIQDEDEYGSDENEDENKNDKKPEKETENLNEKIESTVKNSESTQITIQKDDNKSTEKVLENKMKEVANLLINENKEKSIDNQNSSNKSSENVKTNKTVNSDDDDSFDDL